MKIEIYFVCLRFVVERTRYDAGDEDNCDYEYNLDHDIHEELEIVEPTEDEIEPKWRQLIRKRTKNR